MKSEAKFGVCFGIWFLGSIIGSMTMIHFITARPLLDWLVVVFVLGLAGFSIWLYHQL